MKMDDLFIQMLFKYIIYPKIVFWMKRPCKYLLLQNCLAISKVYSRCSNLAIQGAEHMLLHAFHKKLKNSWSKRNAEDYLQANKS